MAPRITFDQRCRELAAVAPNGGIRLDANETAIFSRQLEHVEERLFEVKYPTGHGIEMVPLLTKIDPGAAEYTYRAFDHAGRAERVANYAGNPPRVDIQGLEVTNRLHSYWTSYGYSVQDLRAAAMAHLPIEERRATAARNVLMRKLDENIWVGDTTVAVYGLANSTLVDVVSVVTGTWSSAQPSQILADLQKLVNASSLASNGEEEPDTVAMSITAYQILTTRYIDTTNYNKTILAAFKEANPNIKKVAPSFRLELANAGGTGGRLVAYKNDPEKLEALVPVEFETFPVQAKSMSFDVTCHMRCGGVVIRYPDSVKYMDGCA